MNQHSFYSSKINHIISKIYSYYFQIFTQKEFNEIKSTSYILYNKLCELRSYIIKKHYFLKKKSMSQE